VAPSICKIWHYLRQQAAVAWLVQFACRHRPLSLVLVLEFACRDWGKSHTIKIWITNIQAGSQTKELLITVLERYICGSALGVQITVLEHYNCGSSLGVQITVLEHYIYGSSLGIQITVLEHYICGSSLGVQMIRNVFLQWKQRDKSVVLRNRELC
jgi:hypothetical protein